MKVEAFAPCLLDRDHPLMSINGLQIIDFCASGADVPNVPCAPVFEKYHFCRISFC